MRDKISTPRVVSLNPAATEILCALGFQTALVGRSHVCGYPPIIKKVPVCTEPTIETNASSESIDKQVKSRIHHQQPLFHLKTKLIEELKPDLLITQSHCNVCAVSLEDLDRELASDVNSHFKVLSLSWNGLADVWASIELVAETMGDPALGREKTRLYQGKFKSIEERGRDLRPVPTVATVEWIDPLMAAGHWVPEMIELAGGRPLFGERNKPSRVFSYEALIQSNPDTILVFACGLTVERMRDELEPFSKRPGWFDLKAVQNNQVYLIDGQKYLNRPGPGLVDSLEILAEILHAEVFDFGHRNDGWEYWGFNRF